MEQYSSSQKLISPDVLTQFRKLDLNYWMHPEKFIEFVNQPPSFKNIPNQISQKILNYTNRDNWCQILKKQYSKIDRSDPIHAQINKFQSESTFAVTCAHQPCLLGGPLYWWIKIAHTIKIARELNIQYPQYHFIPVYYSGNEDHDFDEINHLWIFNKKLAWNTLQTGPVGRMSLDGMNELFEEILSFFTNDEEAKKLICSIQALKEEAECYEGFLMHFVHFLFGSYGLVYFNPDQVEAKKILIPILSKELTEQMVLEHTSSKIKGLESLTYPIQANPRDINIFYLAPQYRSRIVLENKIFSTIDKKYNWTSQEILEELNSNPENFSPNVLIRPLFQETLLPNLMFIGGGAEIAYWLQLKDIFAYCTITFPMLKRRASVVLIGENAQNKIANLGLNNFDFLEPISQIEEKLIKLKSNFPQELELIGNEISLGYEKLIQLSKNIIKGDNTGLLAEIKKMENILDKLLHKLQKDEKLKFETDLTKVQKIKESLFPDNNLQERKESGFQYFMQYGWSFIDELIEKLPGDNDSLVVLLEK